MDAICLALLSSLFERLDDCPFFVKDRDLRYTAANAAMARLCGIGDARAVIGKTARSFFSAPDARRYEAFDARVIATGEPLIEKLDLAAGRGALAWLVFSRLPVRDDDGTVVGVAASARRLAEPERRAPIYARLAAAVAEIEAAPDRPLALAALAARVGVSASQLERDFRRAFGVGPQRFLHKLRIDRALVLLATSASIAHIAQACGYSDQSAFTRRFAELVGLTPTAYRATLVR